jgi:hypothetical protein
MEKKQSSIEWLASNLGEHIVWEEKIIDLIEQAKAMHKKEILIACSKALPITDGVFTAIDKAHDYYNEQFGGNHE